MVENVTWKFQKLNFTSSSTNILALVKSTLVEKNLTSKHLLNKTKFEQIWERFRMVFFKFFSHVLSTKAIC